MLLEMEEINYLYLFLYLYVLTTTTYMWSAALNKPVSVITQYTGCGGGEGGGDDIV